MVKNIKLQLHEEFKNYMTDSSELSPYYSGMNIFVTKLFKEQLKEILEFLKKEDTEYTKSFELYLDTVIINMHTKAKKYKQSIYFDDEDIKDIENQGYTIPFYYDQKKDIFILWGIINSHG